MMAKATHAMALRCEGARVFGQRRKAVRGESNRKNEGMPKIPCRRKGRGKRPAPAMEREYERINHTGTVLNSLCRQALRRPKTNKRLRSEHNTSPEVNIPWEGVPMVPSSLTILERWL